MPRKKKTNAIPNELLRRARIEHAWTQQDVAVKIGGDAKSVQEWEAGYIVPSLYAQQKLCALFQKTSVELGFLPPRIPGQQRSRLLQEATAVYDDQIPPPFAQRADFVGRDTLLNDLTDRFTQQLQAQLIVLLGLPGVGKTELAVHLVHAPDSRVAFPGGILWANLGREANIRGILSRWATLLGFSSAETSAWASDEQWQEGLKRAIGTRRMLIILDDAWHLQDVTSLELSSSCSYVVTTRLPELAQQWKGGPLSGQVFNVPELDEDQGVSLLTRKVPNIVAKEPVQARQLVLAVGGLPLALSLMGSYLAGKSYANQPRRIQTALRRLQDAQTRLHLARPQERQRLHSSLPAATPLSLYAVIDLSIQALEPSARAALSALALFPAKPNSFSEEAACEVAAAPVAALDDLSDSGLLEVRGPIRYTLHQTIHDYADQLLQEYTDGEPPYKRFVSYYTKFVVAHERDYEALTEEQDNVLAMLRVAEAHGLLSPFVQAVIAFSHFLETQGRYKQAIDQLRRAYQVGLKLPEYDWLAPILLYLGRIHEKSGNYSEARGQLEDGLTRARRLNDPLLIGGFLYNLGRLDLNAATQREDIDLAEARFQEGLTLAERLQDPGLLSACLTNLGAIVGWRGNLHQEQEYYERALAVALKGNLRERVSGLLHNLGVLAMNRGELTLATSYYERARDYARQIGHRERMITIIHGLAAIYAKQGNFQRAEQEYQESLKLASQIGHQQLIATTLFNLVDVVKRWDCFEAEHYARKALKEVEAVANPKVKSFVLNNLGTVLMLRGYFPEALGAAQESVVLARQTEDAETMVAALQALAEIEVLQGNIQEAERDAQEGLALAEQVGNPEYQGLFLLTKGMSAQKRGEASLAEQYYRDALALARSTPSHDLISSVFYEMGKLFDQRGDREEAKAAFSEALKAAPEQSKWLRALIEYGLARITAIQGNLEEGKLLGKASVSILERTGHYKSAEVKQWLATLEP